MDSRINVCFIVSWQKLQLLQMESYLLFLGVLLGSTRFKLGHEEQWEN